jgi:hypothetical protein
MNWKTLEKLMHTNGGNIISNKIIRWHDQCRKT